MSGTMRSIKHLRLNTVDLLSLITLTIESLPEGYAKNFISRPKYTKKLMDNMIIAGPTLSGKSLTVNYLVDQGYLPHSIYSEMSANEVLSKINTYNDYSNRF